MLQQGGGRRSAMSLFPGRRLPVLLSCCSAHPGEKGGGRESCPVGSKCHREQRWGNGAACWAPGVRSRGVLGLTAWPAHAEGGSWVGRESAAAAARAGPNLIGGPCGR
jgi:hypothetical protein